MSKKQLPPSLGAEQKAEIKAVSGQIQDAALGVAPMDRALCAEAIARCYEHLGLERPEILFFSSPHAILKHLLQMAPTSTTVSGQDFSSMDFSQLLGNEEELQNMLLNSIQSAQPRALGDWGSEVSLPAHDLESDVVMPFAWQAGWEKFSDAVDKGVGNLIHFQHAVTDALEAAVQDESQEWVLYSGGMNNLWGSAEALGRAQALLAIGMLESAPPALVLGGNVLRSCGWINAFEKLCLVSDRPASLQQTGRARSAEGLRTRVEWRDGEVNEYLYHD